jgi:hypothetical protein
MSTNYPNRLEYEKYSKLKTFKKIIKIWVIMVLLMWGRCHAQNAPFQCEEPLRIINVDIYQDSARLETSTP